MFVVLFLDSVLSILVYQLKEGFRKNKCKIVPINYTSGVLLEPCPFCGESAQEMISQRDPDGNQMYSVLCDSTQGGCGSASGYYKDPLDSIVAWNTRENK